MSALEPKRRGRPPKMMATHPDRLASLTAREKALAIKARARHRYTFDMPLEMYEVLLTQAEAWDQPLPDVVRACIRKGLEHIKQFGGQNNPYIYGQLTPPSQAQIDPSGLEWPPTAGQSSVQPNWDMIPALPLRSDAPVPMQFRGPTLRPGQLPSGATITTTPAEKLDVENTVSPFGDDTVEPF